jgi:hypothetical protein
MNEPFNLRPWEVARLTDRQIAELYFHPRDEQGRLNPQVELPGEEETLTVEEQHRLLFGVGAALGVSQADLQRAWEAKHGRAAGPGPQP